MKTATNDLIKRDLKHIWHPCSQMKDYIAYPPIQINSAQGSFIQLTNGKKIIDAISSWWCKSLGHGHPRLKAVLIQQLDQFEHVISANTTHQLIVELSEKLATLTSSLNKIFYAGDGSCAVEIAMKMSVHSRHITEQTSKTRFLRLANAYHGETCGAMSVSDLGKYIAPYQTMLFNTEILNDIPYVNNKKDPLWSNADQHWQRAEKHLNKIGDQLTAVIIEPILQGAAGMKIYSQDFLKKLSHWCKRNDVHLIADEIMTGLGRTGTLLACNHANIEPDFLCLSKGLTSGFLPFSAVLTSEKTYQLFYDDYETGKAFLHSHTYCGNALAAAVALETLNIIEQDHICQTVQNNESILHELMQDIANKTGKLSNIRYIGAVVAAELAPHPHKKRIGFELAKTAVELGALLRPLDNTLYWMPPLNTNKDVLYQLKEITQAAIEAVYQ